MEKNSPNETENESKICSTSSSPFIQLKTKEEVKF